MTAMLLSVSVLLSTLVSKILSRCTLISRSYSAQTCSKIRKYCTLEEMSYICGTIGMTIRLAAAMAFNDNMPSDGGVSTTTIS